MKTYSNLLELLKDYEAETPFHFGRSLYKYTECGPWTSFLLFQNKDLYYEDEDARKDPKDLPCIGVKIGSIVEGSDYEVPPRVLLFPFTDDALNAAVRGVNEEACEAWEEANCEDGEE
jgi:hypothetical protein